MRDEKRVSVCRVCRAPLAPAGRGRPPVYCSRGCQARAYRRRKDPPPPAPEAPPPAVPSGRRRQIAEAVWRVAAERGLHAASMREIAAEAGVSLRVVQYHFDSKHDLLVAALRMLHEESARQADARVRALRRPSDPRAVLRAVLDEFLPLDEWRRVALRVHAAYYARSLTDPALAEVFLHDAQPLEDLVASLLARLPAGSAGPPPVDPRREADLLVSGVVGLAIDVLHGRRSVADVRRTIDYHLERIFAAGPAGAAEAG
ncbi:TetR/AcrR family transcriptional regulator [Streptomyces sp. CA-181903]|uniref:TetR/AcrR family transcriptional regulator n=1 Tax=Streptomyces sp. CA-181903 TaxID=3240055 RepID=UPI003D93E496